MLCISTANLRFVDFCFNDIVSKKSNRLFVKAEYSASKRLVAFSTYYNHYKPKDADFDSSDR